MLNRKTEGTFIRENIIELEDEKPPQLVNWTSNPKISIQGNTLGFTGYYYYWGSARASVKVGRGGESSLSTGSWYYEVTIKETGKCRIGWALPTYNPGTNTDAKVGDGGDSWGVDGTRQKKYYKGTEVQFGKRVWETNSIVGTMIDFDTNKIYYSVNGGELEAAFTQVLADQLYPTFSVQSSSKLEINFGPDFAYPPKGVFGLNPTLTSIQTKKLNEVFEKYVEREMNVVSGRNLLMFLKDLGATSGSHPIVGVVPWRINAGKLLTLTYEEWMCAWVLAQAYDIEAMREATNKWIQETEDERCFSNYYNYIFRYLKHSSSSLPPTDAIKGWLLTGIDKKWELWDTWQAYVKEKNEHITLATWNQLLPFIKTIGNDPSKFSEDDMWPLYLEEFGIQKLQKK